MPIHFCLNNGDYFISLFIYFLLLPHNEYVGLGEINEPDNDILVHVTDSDED